MVAGMLLIASTSLIDQAMAATLGGGSAAVLSYSGRVVAVILSVGTMALGHGSLTLFLAHGGDWAIGRRFITRCGPIARSSCW